MKARYEELLPKHFPHGTHKEALTAGLTKAQLEEALMNLRKEMPKSRIVIEGLPQRIKDALGINSDSMFFSADNLAKQLYYHSEIAPGEYRGVIAKITDTNTEIYKIPKKYHVVLITNKDNHHAVTLKTTKDSSEAYLLSLFRLDEDPLKQLHRKYERFKI